MTGQLSATLISPQTGVEQTKYRDLTDSLWLIGPKALTARRLSEPRENELGKDMVETRKGAGRCSLPYSLKPVHLIESLKKRKLLWWYHSTALISYANFMVLNRWCFYVRYFGVALD